MDDASLQKLILKKVKKKPRTMIKLAESIAGSIYNDLAKRVLAMARSLLEKGTLIISRDRNLTRPK